MLPKNYRLKTKKDFQKVMQQGKGVGENLLVLKFIKNDLTTTRIGFVVSKKISNKAVVRNKIKRWLREAARPTLPKLKLGYDLIFFTKKGIEEKDFWQIKQAIDELMVRAKLLKQLPKEL